MKTNAKDFLKDGLNNLNEFFDKSIKFHTTLQFEIESSEIADHQSASEFLKKEKPESNVTIKYNLLIKSLEITGTPLDLFNYGFYLGIIKNSKK